MAICPSADDLTSFLQNELPEGQVAAVAEHLEECAACQGLLARLTESPELDKLRKVVGKATSAPLVAGDGDPLNGHEPTGVVLDSLKDWLRSRISGLHLSNATEILSLSRRGKPAAERLDDNTIEFPSVVAPEEKLTVTRIGPYEILRQLGRGGMGVVLEAYDTNLKRPVALKMLRGADAASAERRMRLRREAEAIARLSHPQIVQIYEVGEHEGQPYLVLELVRGGTLEDFQQGQPQPPREAAGFLLRLAQTIEFAHRHGIIHRDLKPSNILLQMQSLPPTFETPATTEARHGFPGPLTSYRSKITDFGLAKLWEEGQSITESGTALGTPLYMAPEQTGGGKQRVGPFTDVYTLGVILYQLLTGHPPFCADKLLELIQQVQTMDPIPPRQWQPKIPRDLETICLRCLAKEPRHRYPTAATLAVDLERFLDGRSILARPVGPLARSWRWCQRKPVLAGLVATILFLLLMLAVGGPMMAFQQMQLRIKADENAGVARSEKEGARQYAIKLNQEKTVVKRFLLTIDDARTLGFADMAKQPGTGEVDYAPLNRTVLQREVAFIEALARQSDFEPELQLARAQRLHQLALLDEVVGEAKLASRELKQALEVLNDLVKNPVSSPVHHAELARLLFDLARIRGDMGFRTEGEGYLRDALALREQLMGNQPKDLSHSRELAIILIRLAELLRETNRRQDAEQIGKRALAMAVRLSAESPGNPQFRDVLAWCYVGQADFALQFADNAAQAGSLCRQALAASEEAIAQFPERREHALLEAAIHVRLGDVAMTSGQLADAEKNYRRAAELQGKLAHTYPFSVPYRVSFAATQQRLGALLAKRGQAHSASDVLSRCIAELAPIVVNEPRLTMPRQTLRDAYRTRAQLFKTAGQARIRIKLQKQATQLDDRNVRELCLADAVRLTDAKEYIKASVEAYELAGEKGLSGEALFKLACVFADCATANRDDAELYDRFVNTTLDMLSRCRGSGFYNSAANRARIRSVSAFDWVRADYNYRQYLPYPEMDGEQP